MRGVQGAADRAVHLVRAYLTWSKPGSRIHDVSLDPRFQDRGVDLLWDAPGEPLRGIEVKGDRSAGKRYFLELVSNVEQDAPGCFLYSEAELLFYVFLRTPELHVLPLTRCRSWLTPRADELELKHTRTRIGKAHYTTVGALVEVQRLLAEVDGVERWRPLEDGSGFRRVATRARRTQP